ncbi:MAG TPA: MlaD family protein, partial [Magnetospirillaceae bacterium]|nr:MlaD family protein [Magnetospirillaceae bacterium]
MPEPADRDPLTNGRPTASHTRRHFPLIWLVPIIALLAAGWLGWRTLAGRGPMITISAASADGIEAGKTKIKHHDIELGTVESLKPAPDLKSVSIEARMNVYAKPHLTQGSRFWVVRPRLSAEGITGLSTLISGSYIEMDPGHGDPERNFTALEDPPVISADAPGTRYVLKTGRLGSIIQGAPISFRGIKVGQVLGYELSDQDGTATVQIFVQAPHDTLVREGSRFWNASGFTVEMGAAGLRLQTESIQAILTGGVAFDVPPGGDAGDVAKGGSIFELYPNVEKARDALFTRKIPFLLHFSGSVDGLAPGAPVRLRGIQVGSVIDVHLEYDAKTDEQTVPVQIDIEPQRVHLLNDPDVSEGEFRPRSYAAFRRFVQRGLRARLTSGSLITGQKLVSLDFMPTAPKAEMIETGPIPEIPTIGNSDIDSVMQSAKDVLISVKSAVDGVDAIVRSPELKHSLASLDHSMNNFEAITKEAQPQIGP